MKLFVNEKENKKKKKKTKSIEKAFNGYGLHPSELLKNKSICKGKPGKSIIDQKKNSKVKPPSKSRSNFSKSLSTRRKYHR